MKQLIIYNNIITVPIYDIIKQLQSELHNGKLRDVALKGDNVLCTCPFHSDGFEDKPGCNIYCGDSDEIEQGKFHCFVCDEAGSLVKFIAACFGKNEEFAKQWLIERYGQTNNDTVYDFPDWETNPTYKKELKETVLDKFEDFHPYMDTRHLDRAICQKFQVKYDPKTECLVFPVRDGTGKLLFLTRRSVKSKIFIIDKDVEKPIYLLDQIIKENIKEAVVVESQINALTLWGWGIPAVALFGCKITPYQLELLNKSPIQHYILALDADKAGWQGMYKFVKQIRKDVFVDVKLLPRGKDVNDLTKEAYDSVPMIDGDEWVYKNK